MRHFFVLAMLLSMLAQNSWSRGGGGCFLPDTPILRADGSSVAINHIQPGDQVESYDTNGKLVTTTVREVITHRVDSYNIVTTEKIVLNVTDEHPFYMGHGKFKTVAALKKGDVVYSYDGSQLSPQHIMRKDKILTQTLVYNLQVDEPHTYFAASIAVHNKGGGGGGGGWGGGGGYSRSHSSRGSGSNQPLTLPEKIFWLGVLVVSIIIFVRGKKEGEDLDYVFPRKAITPKADKTLKLLYFLAKQDETMNPNKLDDRTRFVFRTLQECWEARDYTRMKDLMMPDLYQQHLSQINGLINNHEINRLSPVGINNIDLVNVRYTDKKEQREFTALITATIKDYYEDDRTGAFLRGDKESATFQEFWTFQLQDTGWLLRDIEQSRDSHYLKEENFFEQYTDHQIEKIYGGAVDKLGEAGPWVPKPVLEKGDKVGRMLNFLAASNKLWDRHSMIIRVRSIFAQVHMSLEAGVLDPALIPNLFPEVADQIKQTLAEWTASGNKMEYRNFCVRKVEIVLVKSFDDKSKNEFTARISAHAQRIQLQNGSIIKKDADVTPFVEFWTFGCLDGVWKLKEALPPGSDSGVVAAENTEEGSSLNLVKWYYTKKRA